MGRLDRDTRGICGVKEFWIGVIPEINERNIDSLYAGSLVLDYYLNLHNGNLYLALKDFKGSKQNMDPVKNTLAIYRSIKNK